MLIKLIQKFCRSKTISLTNPDGTKDPYLTRYYIFQFKSAGLYLHKFHRPDRDRDLHNHPWAFAVSYILKGEYEEKRLTRGLDSVIHRKGTLNIIPGGCFHRIARTTPNLYTLFFRGPRVKKWGFLRADPIAKTVYFDEYRGK